MGRFYSKYANVLIFLGLKEKKPFGRMWASAPTRYDDTLPNKKTAPTMDDDRFTEQLDKSEFVQQKCSPGGEHF